MARHTSNPAWQADTYFAMLEDQATERHLVKLTLGHRLQYPGDFGVSTTAEKVGPHIYFDATIEEIQSITDRLHDQQVQYYRGITDYLLYVTSKPLDNYRGIESITWSLYQPFLE